MYKITAHYVSEVPGVYTKEIETATDDVYLEMKKKRMLRRWFNILCPHFNFQNFDNDDMLELIQFEIERLNKTLKGEQNRIFNFIVEEIPTHLYISNESDSSDDEN